MINQQRTALVTGAAGFIGSSFVARLLNDGRNVIAVSRRDPDGAKTRIAVRRAALALGIGIGESVLAERLSVVCSPIESVAHALAPELMATVDSVWHLAAKLSYQVVSLSRSIEINVAATSALYQHVSRHATSCRRFYFVSTAYCAGFPLPDETIPEELHPAPRAPNAYQYTKWSAEMTLRHLSFAARVPITVLRPAVVVGHSRTGKYHGDPFGFYMFLYAAHRLLSLPGSQELRLPPETRGEIHLVPIDVLIENALRLDEYEGGHRSCFEVIHCTGTQVSAEAVARIGAELTGLRISFASPRTALDHLFGSRIEENRIFAAHRFRFEEHRLRDWIGERWVPAQLDDGAVRILINAYLRRLDEELGTLAITPWLRPFCPLLTQVRWVLGPRCAQWLARAFQGKRQRDGHRASNVRLFSAQIEQMSPLP